MRATPFVIALALSLEFIPTARAGWLAYAMETRLLEADMVAVGTVGKVKSTFKRGRDYALAEMQIEDVLKGDKDAKTVDVAFAAKSLIESDQVYKAGTHGLWLMRLDCGGEFYWIDQPLDLQEMADKDKLAESLEHLQELEWGPETNGVQLMVRGQSVPDTDRDMVPSKKQLRGPLLPALQVFMKNSGDHPIYVCDYAGDKPIKIACACDGRPEPVNMYAETWHKPINQGNFICIRPGQVKPVGGAGGAYRMQRFSEPGAYELTATYTAARDGKIYKLDNVWTGQVTSNTMKLNYSVKLAQPAKE